MSLYYKQTENKVELGANPLRAISGVQMRLVEIFDVTKDQPTHLLSGLSHNRRHSVAVWLSPCLEREERDK